MQFGEFFFDGDKRVIYEAPTTGFSYTTDGDGYRIYTPDDEPSAPVQLQYSTYELWSRFSDYHSINLWSSLAFELSGGAYRYTDQFSEEKFSLIDLRLLNDWAFVQSNYPHSTFIKGNLFANELTNITFDFSRITRQGVVPSIFFSDAGERSVADDDAIQAANENSVYASFQGAVWVDAVNGYEDLGTDIKPNGNTERPVKYIPLAVQIAQARGFRVIQVIGDLTLSAGDDVTDMKLVGTSHVNSDIIIETEAICLRTAFESFGISGVLDGNSEINNCVIGDMSFFNGHIHSSALKGTITLGGGEDAILTNCNMLDILNTPVVNCGSSGQNLIMTNYSGRIVIDAVNHVESHIGVGCDAGDVIINDNCTDGVIAVSGTGSVEDNSTNTCYVIDKTIDGTELHNLQRIVEYLRPHHTGTGNVYYWNPYNGNDNWDGKGASTAFKTFAKAHDTAENANHDIIMIVPGDPTGITVITEAINITKDYLFLRGPGRDVIFEHNNSAISIQTSARGTELSGFRISNTTPDSVAVYSSGFFTLCDNIWVENTANGIFMTNHHALIHSCKFHGPTGYAIKMEGTISHGEIYDCTAGDAGESTIQINTTADSGGIKMRNTIIVGSAGYGVTLSATTRKFVSESGNIVKFNTLGNFQDLGTDNITSSGEFTGDANIISVAGTEVTSVDDFKANTVDVDLSSIPEDVWTYVTRELTVAAGLTPEQEAKLDQIITDVNSTLDSNIVSVTGTPVIDVEDFKTDIVNLESVVNTLPQLAEIKAEMVNVQFGKLEITNNQMLVWDQSGTLLVTYDLFDNNGNPTMNLVYRREVV